MVKPYLEAATNRLGRLNISRPAPGGAIRTCGMAVVTSRGAILTRGWYGSCIGSYGSSSDLKGGGERSVVIRRDSW